MFINLRCNQVVHLALSAGLAISSFAQAAPGDLDPAFGTNGQTIVSLGSAIHTITGVVAQGDGKYLVSYEAPDRSSTGGGIARFNADHTLDYSWGYRGVVGARNSYNGYSQSNSVSGLTLSNGQVLAIENDGGFGSGGNGNGQ